MANYNFGASSFTNELWIAQKRVFEKPKGVDVEFVNAGPFDWVFADANGAIVKTLRHENPHSGWTSVDLPSLGLYQNYSVGFRNCSGHELRIKSGTLRYNI